MLLPPTPLQPSSSSSSSFCKCIRLLFFTSTIIFYIKCLHSQKIIIKWLCEYCNSCSFYVNFYIKNLPFHKMYFIIKHAHKHKLFHILSTIREECVIRKLRFIFVNMYVKTKQQKTKERTNGKKHPFRSLHLHVENYAFRIILQCSHMQCTSSICNLLLQFEILLLMLQFLFFFYFH